MDTIIHSFMMLLVFIAFIITVPIILVLLYIAFLMLKHWITHKFTLLALGLVLIFHKNKLIRHIGWQSLSLVIWESND